VVVYYDYFLTLSDEIDLFWTRRRGFGLFPFFFFLNRYVSLAGDLPIVVFGVIGETGFMVRVPARLAALKSSQRGHRLASVVSRGGPPKSSKRGD
jgi:hypothetical protein